jgi:hypothetical protein
VINVGDDPDVAYVLASRHRELKIDTATGVDVDWPGGTRDQVAECCCGTQV